MTSIDKSAPSFDFINKQLDTRRAQSTLRSRKQIKSIGEHGSCQINIDGRQYTNFASNDYLGLSKHPSIIKAWQNAASEFGCGSGGSALVSGYQLPHYELEQLLCEWLDVPAVLLYNCGFSANQAIIKALMHKDALLIQDKLNHASLLEAGMLGAARMKRFSHNDVNALAKKFDASKSDTLVATEGVFSMDGDRAPLLDINQQCQRANALLLVDDAHGVGVLGSQGQGSVADVQIKAHAQLLQMLTFGKAIGVGGACVAASSTVIDYLVNFSRAYVYSTTMPAAQAAAISSSIELIRSEPEVRQQLVENIAFFRKFALELNIPLQDSHTAIQPLVLGSSQLALEASNFLKSKGHWVVAIRPPTVAPNSARLRITLSANHSFSQIESLLRDLKILIEQHKSDSGNAHAH